MTKIISTKFYREYASKYKTVAAKRAFYTREIKAFKEIYSDLKNAYDKRASGKPFGMYLGDKVWPHTVDNAKTNIVLLEKLKNEI